MMILMGGAVVYEWSTADPGTRLTPINLVLHLSLLFLALTCLLTGFAWGSIMLQWTVTSLHDHGISHGPRFSRRWIPFSSIQAFYIEEQEFQGRRFRFLNWQEEGLEEESYALIPVNVDTALIVTLLKSKEVEYSAPNP